MFAREGRVRSDAGRLTIAATVTAIVRAHSRLKCAPKKLLFAKSLDFSGLFLFRKCAPPRRILVIAPE
jgi:hypothetical protein